ncbi:MAG: histidine kinase dimerization/phospho-acceptor domain-containing protein [Balneolales bacterium]
MEKLPSEFVAKMSHDLKTPVGNAMMYAELITEDVKALSVEHPELKDQLEELIHYCKNIHLSSSKLINAIQSWGYTYQIEDGVFELKNQETNLKELFQEVIDKNSVFIKGKLLDVSLDYQSVRETYHTDSEVMRLVFDNMLILFISLASQNSGFKVLVDDQDGGIRIRFIAPKAAFSQNLIDMYSKDISISDVLVPGQGILKPGGYGLLFVNLVLRLLKARHGVIPEQEGKEQPSYWMQLPLS